MVEKYEQVQVAADAIARLRSALARALVDEKEPSSDSSILEDLSALEENYLGKNGDKVQAFLKTIRDPNSLPGVNRSVVFARGQRFLLTIAMELEDLASKITGPKPSKDKKKDDSRKTPPRTPFDPALLALDGIGPKTAARLASRGVTCPKDLLFVLPRRYDDRRTITPIKELQAGQRMVTSGTVKGIRLYGRPWKRIMELELVDGDDSVKGMWFSNRRPRSDSFEKGKIVTLAGLVSNYKGRLQIAHPVVVGEDKPNDRIGRVVPIYPEVPGVAGRTVEKAIRCAAEQANELLGDPLPSNIQKRRGLMSLQGAIQSVHLPPMDISNEALDAWVDGSSPAHQRLAYDEFFYIQLALARRRQKCETRSAPRANANTNLTEELGGYLDIIPTGAQKRVTSEILKDMAKAIPMQRLLQGDVGSGKTFVALCAIIAAARSGLQAALMAPTEILAEQHMRTIYPILDKLGIRVALHIGQARSATRKKNLAAFESGLAQVAIGTHALIQESVSFKSLGLAVVDEQHRFGVSQRLGLVGKGPDGSSPHLLVMTATPIPRTLALTVHGDLDISSIDELPVGRTPIETRVWSRSERGDVIALAEEAVERGEQVYVVCPIIEESKKLDVKAAEDVYQELAQVFGSERTRLLHGRLSSEEKEAAMADFSSGIAPVLITTTVVEVGVDVAGATVMIIEGADRFGLAQLHQLRGRVGRSTLKSYCHLVADPKNEDALARLDVLSKSTDGFIIAEADLQIRGPGELYGRRQAGLPGFRYGHPVRDAILLQFARDDAKDILDRDPDLRKPTGMGLKEELERRIMAEEGPIGEEAG